MCGDMNNRFFRLNSTETAFVAAESVFVGTAKVSVKKIMVYKMSWMRTFYINPMARSIGLNTGERDNRRAITSNSRHALYKCSLDIIISQFKIKDAHTDRYFRNSHSYEITQQSKELELDE
jgi:hypothetical protein